MSHNKIIKSALLLSAAACLATSCGRKSLEEQLIEESADFTLKQCPKQLDEFFTMDSMVYDEATHSRVCYYSIQGKADDPDFFPKETVEDFKENMTINIRADLNMKKLKEAGISFGYRYISKKTGQQLMEYTVGPEDYNGAMKSRTFNAKKYSTSRYWTKVNCPQTIEEGNVLDSMWYDSIARVVHYDFTISGVFDNDSTFDNPSAISESRKELIKNLKTDESVQIERDREKLDFNYRYFSATTKRPLLDIMIKNKDLQ